MVRTDRRITKTRRAISEAFREQLQSRAFRDISVNDIADLAQISRTTFYHHYKDKYDWLEQTIREYLAIYTETYRITDLMDQKTIIEHLTELFRSISATPLLCQLILANENSQLLYTFFRETLLEQFRQHYGDFAKLSPQEDLTVHYIAASTSAFIEWWARNNTLFTPEELARCIYSFHHLENDKKA